MNWSDYNILLVDDDMTSQFIIAKSLQSLGDKLDICSSSDEAIKRVEFYNYDLILVDLNLPVVNGFELSKSLKHIVKYNGSSPKIIGLTVLDHPPCLVIVDDAYKGQVMPNRCIEFHGIETERSITIVDWTNEEGSRFAPAMVASGVWAGALDRDWAYDRTDINGKRFEDELIRIGYKKDGPCQKFPVHCYYEYHIEQGPMLERQGKIIGAPKGILCLHWYDIYLTGEANQVGPTPMEGRHDALCAAAEMILKVNSLPDRMGGNLVATVGEIQNRPNSRNIIPDKVHFTVDIRSWDDDQALKAWDLLRSDIEAIAGRRGCPIKIEETWRVEHSPFDEKLVQRILDTADALGYPSLHMVSGAGHDASYMNQVCPTAMIFVPSIDGRSHVEVENTTWEDCEAGANVLLHAILQSANESSANID